MQGNMVAEILKKKNYEKWIFTIIICMRIHCEFPENFQLLKIENFFNSLNMEQ